MLYVDSTTNRRFGLCVHFAGGLLVLTALGGTYALQYAPTKGTTENAKIEKRYVFSRFKVTGGTTLQDRPSQ